MSLRFRSSKFRHVYGAQCRREATFENVRITRNTHDSNFCSVNPKYLAVVTECSGGGSFIILDVNRPGRVDVNCPRVCGHAGAVMDVKFSPFNDNFIASASDDNTVKLWTLPENGPIGNLSDWTADLHGHSRKVVYLEWHPTASNVLMSVGYDHKVMIWNVEQAEPITAISCHKDTIHSVSWGRDGSLISSTNKEKLIRVIDPRTAQVAAETKGHCSVKPSKAVFVGDNFVFTTGFSRSSHRQCALWDVRKFSENVSMEDIDSSSGILLPYLDVDTNVVFLAGKGDGMIRYFEIDKENPGVHFLNVYQSPLPQRGLGMMPKRGIDPSKNEITRFYKLHGSKNVVEPISMIIPRKAEGFQHDVFCPTKSDIPSCTADEWKSGINRGPILINLEDGTIIDKPRSSMSPAVQPQNVALSKPPQITTYKALPKQAPPQTNNMAPKQANRPTGNPPLTKRVSPEAHTQQPSVSPEPTANQNDGKQLPASIKNIRRLSMNVEEYIGSNDSPLANQPVSTAPAAGSGPASTRTMASPSPSIAPPPSSPAFVSNHVNGFASDDQSPHHIVPNQEQPPPPPQRASPTSPSTLSSSTLSSTPSLSTSTSATTTSHPTRKTTSSTKATSLRPTTASTTSSSTTSSFSSSSSSSSSTVSQTPPHSSSRYSRFTRNNPARSNTVAGTKDHVSAVKFVIGQPSSALHSNAIHVRKVWSPHATPASPSLPAGVASPGTDSELKKAYFRQLEEIKSLQEQVQLKDRRIKQLETELSQMKEREADLGPGESNC